MAEYYLHRLMRPFRRAYYHVDYFIFKLFKGFHVSHIDRTALRKILVVELTMIGDIVVATPAFDAIKKLCPKAQLHVLMQRKFSAVLENNSSIDHILGVEQYPSLLRFDDWRFLLQRIKQENYDAVVILHHGTFAISLLMLLARIPLRIGCCLSGLLVGKGFFLTHKPTPYKDDAHVVEQNMGVVHLLGDVQAGAVQMPYSDKDRKVAEGFLRKSKIRSDRPIIAIHTGTRHDSHQWYENRFAQVADSLIERYGAQIIFTGDDYDYENFVKYIQKLMKHKSVYAKTSLTECVALLSKCDMLLSLDTSMVHMGAAAGIPVLGLYGSGKPATWRPWGKDCHYIFNDHVACFGCRRTTCTRSDYICMNSITVEQVLDKIQTHFKKILKKK